MENNYSNSSGTVGCLIGLIVFGLIVWWGYNHFFNKEDYSKPWFTGVATQQVCSTGSNTQCYYLNVHSDGENLYRVNFNNGGYLHGYSECHEAPEGLYEFDRFCRFWDQDGRKWDIQPNLAAYPEYRQ